jgi:multidrug resistance efflux pump
MENSILYNTKSINFIKILFRFCLVFLLITVLFILFFNINDTVSFEEGLIYSDNPQEKIIAPNEVRVVRINVKEGQEVKKGDTLFILENVKTKVDYEVANLGVNTMRAKINMINKLIASCVNKKEYLKQLINIQSNIYSTDREKTEQEIQSLNNKMALSFQQNDIINEKFKTDSILYSKGAISKLELTEQNNKKIDDKKGIVDINTYYNQKKYDYQNLFNNYKKTNNDLKQSILEIDNQITNYKREILEFQSQIQSQKFNLNYITDELGKLLVLACIDGTISNIFNTKQSLSIINKGDLLAIVAPKKETFYAKIALPEKDLTYIKQKQNVNLKVDAYNYYKFGAVKGSITYVSPSDIERNFYCNVKLNSYNNNINLKAGYKLKGEVIIEEMKLYEYILKKLLNKIDNTVYPIQNPNVVNPGNESIITQKQN